MFFDSCSSHDELAETLTDCLRFCEDCVITSKTVIIFPNDKPWITKHVKTYLNKKKYAFMRGDKTEVRELDKEVGRKAKLAKLAYKDKVEEKLKVGNAKDAWRGLNTMIGRKKNKQQAIKADNPRGLANELNRLQTRVDVTDFSNERDIVCNSLVPSPV